MPESFGARLRQRRERQQIALATIAVQTKIKLSLLEALERDDVSHWPCGIFRRAFVRAYAQAIALDPDIVVREFLELYPDPTEPVTVGPLAAQAAESALQRASPPTRLRHFVSSALGSLTGFTQGSSQDRGSRTRHDRSSAAEHPPIVNSGPTNSDAPLIVETDDEPVRTDATVSFALDLDAMSAHAAASTDSGVAPVPASAPASFAFDPAAADAPVPLEQQLEAIAVDAPVVLEPKLEAISSDAPGPVDPLDGSAPASRLDSTDARVDDTRVDDIPANANVPDANARDLGIALTHASFEPDLEAAAHFCTELARAARASDAAPLLHEAVSTLDALGLIVWTWDAQAAALRPALAHGYSDKVLTQIPPVKRDAANATAAAFRTAHTCAVEGSDHVSGALVVPLLTPAGCIGVLAIELPNGNEQRGPVRALATMFAALLARVITGDRAADLPDRRLA